MMVFERHAATAAQSSMCSAHTGEQGLGAARSGRRAVGGTRKSRLVDAQHLPSGDGARLFDWLELLDDPDDVLAAYGAFGHSVVVLDVLVISIIRVPTVP